MRLEFAHDGNRSVREFEHHFAVLAANVHGTVRTFDSGYRMRMAIAVSKYDHCLLDLLYRVRIGELPVEISAVVSNHEDLRLIVENQGVPFHALPKSGHAKDQQEEAFLRWVGESSDFLVLARYMQILSSDFLQAYGKDVINIHHSFLPSFKGANPYRQAYERGVKLIGATAHYATADLDEGPIIAQSVERVTHRDDIESLKSVGRHLEQMALATAVKAHCEHRVIRLEQRTVVFD
jgi:formyltetrahydrofolate deformylase